MSIPIDRSRFVKEITAPCGQRFLIRRVSFMDFIAEVAPELSGQLTIGEITERLQSKSGDAEAELKTRKFYLTNGIVEPKVWFGNDAECPADQISYQDIAADATAIISEILDFSTNAAVIQSASQNGAVSEAAKV